MLNANPYTVAGCDVRCDWIDVAAKRPDCDRLDERRFGNTPSGHRALITWLTKRGFAARIAVEASGLYSLDLALALGEAPSIEVMIAHPRALRPSTDSGKTTAGRRCSARRPTGLMPV